MLEILLYDNIIILTHFKYYVLYIISVRIRDILWLQNFRSIPYKLAIDTRTFIIYSSTSSTSIICILTQLPIYEYTSYTGIIDYLFSLSLIHRLQDHNDMYYLPCIRVKKIYTLNVKLAKIKTIITTYLGLRYSKYKISLFRRIIFRINDSINIL